MARTNPLRLGTIAVTILVAAAAWILVAGQTRQQELSAGSEAALRRPTGYPQLVSTKPIPEMDGEECEWVPASASSDTMLLAAFQAQGTGVPSSPMARNFAGPKSSLPDISNSFVDVDRAPVRVVRDSYPTYSAVGVDLGTNEVYLQDENLFGFMVFDRMTNTPPSAKFSEPKRRIQGNQTHLEFNCSLWIDPRSGDVYSVNNDMVDLMVVFPRGVKGNVPPKRQLHTPHRTFGIAVDDAAKELYLTVQHPPQVVVYHKEAANEERPIRILRGEHTKLEDAHGIALDTRNNWMFVANHGSASGPRGTTAGHFDPPSITVFPLKASGDTAPLRTIAGPKTRLNWPALLYADQEHGDLYVANDMEDSILVFKLTDSGDVAPNRVIQGPKTGIKNPTSVYLDPVNNELWVSNMGAHSATVYPRTANGDVAPLRTIRSAPLGKQAQMIGNPGAVAYDTKREEILVPN